jgi:hypothetical protein
MHPDIHGMDTMVWRLCMSVSNRADITHIPTQVPAGALNLLQLGRQLIGVGPHSSHTHVHT